MDFPDEESLGNAARTLTENMQVSNTRVNSMMTRPLP